MAVKALSLQSMQDWKQLDLFEREAQTLKQLRHPGIPQYVADFEDDTDKDRGYFLVQAGHSPHSVISNCVCFLTKLTAFLFTPLHRPSAGCSEDQSPTEQLRCSWFAFAFSVGKLKHSTADADGYCLTILVCITYIFRRPGVGPCNIVLSCFCTACTVLQDLAQGKSLVELVKGGWRADEAEVTRIAKELLNILDYLASRRPAVTHRCPPSPLLHQPTY